MHPYPPFPPGPHHPQYPFDPRMWYTDVEPAYEKYAECECHMPPMPDNCVCVTQEDAQNWNGAYSAYSAISAGFDVQAIQSAAQLLTSADYWNQTYDAVSAGSATWNQLPAVSSHFTSATEKLMWLLQQTSAVHTDLTLTGDGSKEFPLGVEYADRVNTIVDLLNELYSNISQYDIEKFYKEFKDCETDAHNAINSLWDGHVQNYELILQLMGKTSGSNAPYIWLYKPEMRSDDPDTYSIYKLNNTIYYSTYQKDENGTTGA